MTLCLRVRVGHMAYLVPAGSIGAIALYRSDDDAIHRQRVIDARRMVVGGATSSPALRNDPVAVEWITPQGRPGGFVLVDDVEGLIEIDGAAIASLPNPAGGLGILFDGFWYDAARSAFLLRLRATKLASIADLRQLAGMLAPLAATKRAHHVDR